MRWYDSITLVYNSLFHTPRLFTVCHQLQVPTPVWPAPCLLSDNQVIVMMAFEHPVSQKSCTEFVPYTEQSVDSIVQNPGGSLEVPHPRNPLDDPHASSPLCDASGAGLGVWSGLSNSRIWALACTSSS